MKNSFYKISFYGMLALLFLILICSISKSSNIFVQDNKLLKVKMMESSLAQNSKNSNQVSYGMFATEPIKKGEIIENCPVLVEKAAILNKAGIIKDYYFDMPNREAAFPLGYGGMYNHSNNHNADTPLKNFDLNKRIMTVTANKDISPGEEVTVNYGNNYWKSRGIIPN